MVALTETHFIGIDQGSGATKGVVIDQNGAVCFESAVPVATDVASDGCVEQDPAELLQSVTSVLSSCRAAYPAARACGLSFQSSGVLAWERSGKILHRMLSWRDTRTRPFIDTLHPHRAVIEDYSGLPLSAHYAAGKIHHLQHQYSRADQLVATLDTFVLQQLADAECFVTDDSMAARSQLYSLREHTWSPELCSLYGVSIERLPQIQPSIGPIATIGKLPVTALLRDQQAALYAGLSVTTVALTLGTIGSLVIDTSTELKRADGWISSVLHSVAHESSIRYLLEGISHSPGEVFSKLLEHSSHARVEAEVQGYSGEVPVVAFQKSLTATPFWGREISALALGDTSQPVARRRALYEHVAFSISYLIDVARQAQIMPARSVLLSGGYGQFSLLIAIIEELAQVDFCSLLTREAGAVGAACAAAHGVGRRLNAPSVPVLKPSTVMIDRRIRHRYELWKELICSLSRGVVPQGAVSFNL